LQSGNNQRGLLTVTISGLNNDRGNVKIGLFNSEASWDDKEKKFAGAQLNIANRKAVWVLKDIPYGQYAIKFFHDENNDDKLNTNVIGMPKETYGFYKSGTGKFIPPGFDKAKFRFDTPRLEIVLKN
jgi:uncharacterized protein (DUF2141 family)